MKRRTQLAGGVVLGAIALGIWLGSFWKGPGLGGGAGLGTGSNVSDVDRNARVDGGPPSAPLLPATQSSSQSGNAPTQVLVVIHEDRYRVLDNEDFHSGADMDLDALKALVAQREGNADGVRVRVWNEASAQEGARSDLYRALAEVGVKKEEIQEHSGFVD